MQRFAGFALPLLGIASCLLLTWASARAGFSRLLGKYATVAASLPAADQAVSLASSDPESHRSRAAVLHYLGRSAEAVKEYELAVSLRPRDDMLWLELGTVRDEIGDSPGALNALNESVRAAPYYAHPRWQRGNILLRMGRYDEAFADLRLAAASDDKLLPSLIDLAWGVSRANVRLTEQLVKIEDGRLRLAFAKFLARRGKAAEVLEQLRGAENISAQDRGELVRQLIDSKAFEEAFAIWSDPRFFRPREGLVYDGGFETPLSLDETGFGWRVAQGQNSLSLSLDAAQMQRGAKSLRIQFKGNSDPGTPLLYQLVMLEPSQRYRLDFAVKTEELVTGGPPIVTVNDAINQQVLGQSAHFEVGSNDWGMLGFEFTTTAATKTAVVVVKRENCASAPCPIFGIAWLDSFSIKKVVGDDRVFEP